MFADPYLRTLGISDAQARRRVARGVWRRLHEGVYADAGTPDSAELRAEAALTALPLGALSHLAASRTLEFGGFRVTSVERTLVDLGKVLEVDDLQRCVEDQVLDRRTTVARVESTFGELATRGRPGIARARTVLARLDDHPPPAHHRTVVRLRRDVLTARSVTNIRPTPPESSGVGPRLVIRTASSGSGRRAGG